LLPIRTSGSHCATASRSFENTLQNSSREVIVATGIQVGSAKPRYCYTPSFHSRFANVNAIFGRNGVAFELTEQVQTYREI
jgi:hypothetical protein